MLESTINDFGKILFGEDADVDETQEWIESLASLIRYGGAERAAFILDKLQEKASEAGITTLSKVTTPYRNTISLSNEKKLPGDVSLERKIRSLIRWNALVMVNRANYNNDSLGGHISSYSSAATLYEVGFNHFFRGGINGDPGDLVYFQGHISPGIYARSYIEGRLSEDQLDNFRREVDGCGLSSYPHPWLMPDYWQFPTVSMGLGPITAIYQAHVMRYMAARNHIPGNDRKVWAFIGDGECDEPETLGAISLAGREKLNNLIFVINCNLQRLDGLVRGNGKIVQELEANFRGAGWNVIKVLWGGKWDALFAKDKSGLLQRRMDEVCDGELQNYKANGGSYTRKNFFGKYPELLKLVEGMTDEDIMALNRGGHDPQKVYAAYYEAFHNKGSPTVILAQTVKGYGLGGAGESANIAHNVKKMTLDDLGQFRTRFSIPVSDDQIKDAPYYRPAPDSEEVKYIRSRRTALGGFLPSRVKQGAPLRVPTIDAFDAILKGSGLRNISTTMVFVRYLSTLIKNSDVGKLVVPIVPDEARTFGMEGMFRQLGIYSSEGQRYTPHDHDQVMFYKEDEKGQILEEGLNEAGAMSAWIAAASAYSTYGKPLLPFYIYYSMFGFQRIGDLAWLAGDMRAKGFLIGATSGRTTLNGEGLQHQDGHSHLLGATIPNCLTYDPTYGYELAVIITEGLRRMYRQQESIFYYITVMNENYHHPEMPRGVEDGIIRGIYKLKSEQEGKVRQSVQLMGSGSILREAEEASKLLLDNHNIGSNVWSVTSINELAKDGRKTERWNRLHPDKTQKQSYITRKLKNHSGPFVISTDYIKAYAEQLRCFIPGDYRVLGTDGFGRSDSREKLRNFFEVDRYHIAIAALKALADDGKIEQQEVAMAIKSYGIDPDRDDPEIS